jgi:hypothetical protein
MQREEDMLCDVATLMRRVFVCVSSLVVTTSAVSALASSVNVTPANMNGWAFGSFDGAFNPVVSGPYVGTAQMVSGPAGQPLGSGSAQLATNPGFGDGAETIATNNFNGMLLSKITTLGYWADMTSNNGQQFPYLIVGISTTGSTTADDFLEFEPPYQTQATALNTWQSWDALNGQWYDENGTAGSGPGTNTVSLSTLLANLPSTATIADLGTQFPGFSGVQLQVGFGSSGDEFNGYVDAFSLGTTAGTTTYNFDPAVAVPLPLASVSGGLILIACLGCYKAFQKYTSLNLT